MTVTASSSDVKIFLAKMFIKSGCMKDTHGFSIHAIICKCEEHKLVNRPRRPFFAKFYRSQRIKVTILHST